jgi:coatomer subunit beta
VLGEIPILASEQRLLDEANGGEEGAGEDAGVKKDDKLKEGGGQPRVLADGTYATVGVYKYQCRKAGGCESSCQATLEK